MIPNVLSIAGLDPSGGAGILTDIKTFSALGCHGMGTITAGTVQNTQGVSGVFEVTEGYVAQQIQALFEDSDIAAIKIGMVYDARVIDEITSVLDAQDHLPPIVVDPVMVATSGDRLMNEEAVSAVKEKLIPLATLVTPNIPEAEILLGQKFAGDLEAFAAGFLDSGMNSILVKGGHENGEESVDFLLQDGVLEQFSAPRIETQNTHGTGCTLSSAIAAYLAHGSSLKDSVQGAKDYITGALQHADDLRVGKGSGPVDHFYKWR